MESAEDINFQDSFNEKNKIERKKNSNYYKYRNKIFDHPDKNPKELYDNDYNENKNYFRKKFKNDKIKNKNINRTLNDIYDTINSINKINKKIYKIFYKRGNTKENTNESKNIKNNSIKSQIINEYRNKSNKIQNKKSLQRAYYSCDNIFQKNNYSLNKKDEHEETSKNDLNEFSNKLDDKSILYISSYITEELNKNKINNKLNFDYKDIHLKERLNNYKKKLKRNQTSDNIFDLNHFRNSKNIKDIIILEEYKQNEFQKLENIKGLKNKYKDNISKKEKDDSFEFNKIYKNHKNIKKKPFCFNDNININKKQKYNSNNSSTSKMNKTNYFFNKIFSINDDKVNQDTKNHKDSKNQNIYNKNYNTSIINKLNFNYQIYKNILNNN